jgi:hypothetical protein
MKYACQRLLARRTIAAVKRDERRKLNRKPKPFKRYRVGKRVFWMNAKGELLKSHVHSD